MINEERLEKALHFLTTTDEPCAALRADMERTEFKAKAVKAVIFKTGTGSVADRTAEADAHAETVAAYEVHFKAMHAYHALNNNGCRHRALRRAVPPWLRRLSPH
jgi:hypothetical protein